MESPATGPRIEQLYVQYKPLLASIAYRMLGSLHEAEDAVQDVFVALSKLGDTPLSHPKAYLVKLVTNRILNMLKASSRKREHYPGQWLPEPVIELDMDNEPHAYALRREKLGYALLVLLQTCAPMERVVFVLRESLGYSYSDMAALLDKSEPACRKLFSRASAKLGQLQRIEAEVALDDSLAKHAHAFARAIDNGEFEAIRDLLTADAVMLSDGGGVVRSALNPIQGRDRITAFFSGIGGKGSLQGNLIHVWVSGQRGLLLQRGDKPPYLFAFEPSDDLSGIRNIYVVSNPEKLVSIKPTRV